MLPTLIIILSIILFILVLRRFLLVIEVRGISMSPTLNNGDRVIVCRYWFHLKFLKRKIVVFNPPIEAQISELFIKRLTALPNEQYTTHIPWTDTLSTWKIPKDNIFVESDNKTSRGDSRSWGPIPHNSLVGVVILHLNNKPPASSDIFMP